MKVPKKMKHYCRKCQKHTVHTLNMVHKSKRSAMKSGQRRRSRIKVGHGDAGHYSKKPIKDWARNSKVASVKDANLECSQCKQKSVVKGGYKAKKFEIIK